jgi:adenylate cyclase class 2
MTMDIEYEAKFTQINKDDFRKKLKSVGAKLIKPECLYKRAVFFLPKGHEILGSWVRVRDEGDKITMSLKTTTNGNIELQKEILLIVDNYDLARQFLEKIGCVEKAYQETKREIWQLNGVEITIDQWPYLESYVEIEGKNEEVVKQTAEILGFDYSQAIFGAVDQLISKKYGIPENVINDKIKRIVFNEENPFLKW